MKGYFVVINHINIEGDNVIYKDVTELVGNTPMVFLDKICKKEKCKGRIAAKLENTNPSGSAKDRAVLRMIEKACQSGMLLKNGTIIEPTSGNTGIALAAIGCSMGYKVILTMPNTMSKERIALLEAYGAKVILTPGEVGMTGAIEKAKELSKKIGGSVVLNQFSNQENKNAHYASTGPELWRDTQGELSYLVAGVGTGGTICGCAQFLKEQSDNIRIIAVEPEKSAVLSGKESGSHEIQGIGAGFVPDLYDRTLIDEVICVSELSAYSYCRDLAVCEGILAGISSGAALCAAVQVAKRREAEEKTIGVILPDSGDRYLSVEALFQRSSNLE